MLFRLALAKRRLKMLERFRKAKEREIAALVEAKESGEWREPVKIARPSFSAALGKANGIAVIAEFKRASPSRGIIREDLPLEEAVKGYGRGGAAALSVLTEEKFFHGSLNFIDSAWNALAGQSVPILRKDFIFHPLQIAATARTKAAAILLIARLVPDVAALREFQEMAGEHDLEAVVEVFDESDLELARRSGAKIIQVNARDLATLKVSRQRCLELIAENPPLENEIWIAASGISTSSQLLEAGEAGFKAALVGTALMEKPDPGKALAELLGNVG